MGKERGIALVTTLLLGAIALALVGTLLYMITTGTRISGTEKRYSTALEAAKGAAEYIMVKLLSGSLTCNGGKACSEINNSIDLGPYSSLEGFDIDAEYLGEVSRFGTYIYSVRVTASSGREKAQIDFVYRVE
ncbi:MAG TPA: hypothetical protein EYP11_03420 [Aquificaceae bacterium]|nr:hypothetical protein [Aquificaceae bacterium]